MVSLVSIHLPAARGQRIGMFCISEEACGTPTETCIRPKPLGAPAANLRKERFAYSTGRGIEIPTREGVNPSRFLGGRLDISGPAGCPSLFTGVRTRPRRTALAVPN